MGFLDRAKELADQAQKKLDEVQTQFNERQQTGHAPQEPAAEAEEQHTPTGPEASAQRLKVFNANDVRSIITGTVSDLTARRRPCDSRRCCAAC